MYLLRNKTKVLYLILTSVFITIMGCKEENIVEPPKIVGDVFVIDTLNVNITYDDTPGFKYPMMRHDIHSVAHLVKKGNISTYIYNCPEANIDNSSGVDYINRQEPGYKFRYKIQFWNRVMFNPNKNISYSFLYGADLESGSKNYTYNSSTSVIYSDNGIKPEENSKQLTGPDYYNYNPQYSVDGKWIYFQNSGYIFRLNTDGSGYEEIENFNKFNMPHGHFQVIDNSHLAFVLWKPNNYSKIVIKDLQNMTDAEYEVKGYLWGTIPIRVPNTDKYLNILDFNSTTNYKRELLVADIKTQKVDTLFKDIKGGIFDYTINPVNHNLCAINIYGNIKNVLEYNFQTNQTKLFLSNIKFDQFKFLPNGVDYGYIMKDEKGFDNIFLNINGIDKQLTTYPGDVYEFSFSPNGNYAVFSSNRRGETQSWSIKL